MKQKFSKSWKSSIQPRKQVKFKSNAPHHIKRKFLSAPLNKILKTKHKIRNIEVRKGDEVKIMRGNFKDKKGKIGKIDLKNSRVQVEGVQRTKAGGEKVETWFAPSSLQIIELMLDDAKRLKSKDSRIKSKDSKLKSKEEAKK